ncbi:glycosyltransferase family 2 protein [Mariniplasma anaerobium]|uniref:Glycosyltransferase 2-like domain-containing protein n=1 Tax=Mariniplasma anaerobium TaxID=2735436 RepID=A0A7U9XVZ5_9MOLU|nr:glycosyltransferase family 2 protein [Mariniplasma anaerobium]BCR36093.1 hypothetical protein MPAN_009860 [Mariniplasma anaerobium]
MIIGCVILNYNDYPTTLTLLNMIKRYESINYIVVVDNNSTDNSYSILAKEESSKIHLIRTQLNGGYSYGNNIGISHLSKYKIDLIIIANPDILFEEDIVKKMIKSFMIDKNLSAVAPYALNSTGRKTLEPAWKLNNSFRELMQTSKIISKLFKDGNKYSEEEIRINCCSVDILPGSFLMLDYKKFESIGFFDESVFLYCEERIMAVKFKEKGYKSKLLIDESYIHNHSTSINKSIKSYHRKQRIWLKSRKYYLLKYRSSNTGFKVLVHVFYIYLYIELLIIAFAKKYFN